MFILFTASAFRKLPSVYVFSYFPFGFEGRIWDLIVSVPDHCLSFYFIHDGFVCTESSLVLDANLPHLGASPDGIVECQMFKDI